MAWTGCQQLRDLVGPAPADWREIAERVEHAFDDPKDLAARAWSHDPLDKLVVQLGEREPSARHRVELTIEAAARVVETSAGASRVHAPASVEPGRRPLDRDHGLDLGL